MAATANRRKQDDKNLEILRELISINGNKYCLDCNQRGPTYVNTTIGSFVCSKCSGMLRGLTPPHRVKSISMATFTPEEIEFVRLRGNDFCRRVWLGLYEGESVNFTEEQSVKDFMSDKYEKKRYYLESTPSSVTTNGSSTQKSKSKSKAGNVSANTAPLVSISPQMTTLNNNNSKMVSNLLTNVNENTHKLARPIANNFSQPLLNNLNNVTLSAPGFTPQVPDFPVDFSTADIYNSSQYNSNINNNNSGTQPSMTTSAFNVLNPPTSTANDRYAALADLDHALRQQKQKNMEDELNINSKNPFQSPATNDLFANKNPFFSSGWSPAPAPINPFMPSTNNGGFNSKNPFL